MNSSHGPMLNVAVAAYELLMNQPTSAQAIEVGKQCFPGIEPWVCQALYLRVYDVEFDADGNRMRIKRAVPEGA